MNGVVLKIRHNKTKTLTSFSTKCEILADLWINYRDDENVKDFIAYNDLGLPLAYLVFTKAAKVNNDGIKLIEDSFDLLLDGLEITDKGYENLEQVFEQSEDKSSVLVSSANNVLEQMPRKSAERESVSNAGDDVIFGYVEWARRFQPIRNHFYDDRDEYKFETFGEQLDWPVLEHPNRVWTYLTRDQRYLIVPGLLVEEGRIGHYVTQVPWSDEATYCLLSLHRECRCSGPDAEPQDNCNDCQGTGLVYQDFD